MHNIKIIAPLTISIILSISCTTNEEVIQDFTFKFKVNSIELENETYQCNFYANTGVLSQFDNVPGFSISSKSNTGITVGFLFHDIRNDTTLNECITEEVYYSKYDTINSYCVNIEGLYLFCNKSVVTYINSENEYYQRHNTNGQIHLTNCDYINKEISGTFEFEIRNEITNELLYDITDGVFENLKYE